MERFGISTALLTPFAADGQIDLSLFAGHARSMLQRGASSITIFGTTGEGASVSAEERYDGLRFLISAGTPPEKIIQTVYASAVDEAASQVDAALKLGVSTFLLVPPFYFKGCRDDGLFDWHAQLVARTDPGSKFILYHIPQVTGIPLSANLVERLAIGFRGRMRAIKDSSGDWNTASKLLSMDVIPVLVGDERLLHRALARGAAGAITGIANLYPERMNQIFESATEDKELSAEVSRIVENPVIPALKALLARQCKKPSWTNTRAPLCPLEPKALAEIGL